MAMAGCVVYGRHCWRNCTGESAASGRLVVVSPEAATSWSCGHSLSSSPTPR